MKEHKCDICKKACGQHINYAEYVPFIVLNGRLTVGVHRGCGDEHDTADFYINLSMERKTDKVDDICEDCADKVTNMVCDEFLRKKRCQKKPSKNR